MSNITYSWYVESAKERLDTFLKKQLDSSRNQVEQLIKKGFVYVNDQPIKKKGYQLKPGYFIQVIIPHVTPSQEKKTQVDFNVEVVYEDSEILVINKEPGIVVHPAPSVKEPTLVDWLKMKKFQLSTLSGEERQGIVHRLDKETSGLMVIAKTNASHRILAEQLQKKMMGRYYLALIEPPLKSNLIVEKPIARNPKNRLKMGVVESGKFAKTAFAKIALSSTQKEELIAAKLYTGRTHQIRVHLASLHRHILGDGLYGFKSKKDNIKRVFLHAYILYLIHPQTKKRMQFVAPIPKDMESYLQANFDMEFIHEKINPNTFESLFDYSDGMWITAQSRTKGEN